MRIYAGSTVGELVQIGLADDYRARGPQARRQFAVTVGGPVGQRLRTGSRNRACYVAKVLERNGYPVKRAPATPARDLGFGGARLFGSAFSEYFEERSVKSLQSVNAVERRSSNLDRGHAPRSDKPRKLADW